MINLNDRRLDFLALCYAYAGCFVFLFGWVKAVAAVPAAVLIAAALALYARDLREKPEREAINISPIAALMILAAVAAWCTISGCGAFFLQMPEWDKHNAILNDLITHSWPVYYHQGGKSAMLSYCIGQYLVPAAVGKLTQSFRTAEIAVLLWNIPGVYFAVLLLLRAVKADTAIRQAVTVGIFFFFGTLLFLGKALYGFAALNAGDVADDTYWLSKSVYLQYPYNWAHLRWEFAQTIVPWIVTALFANESKSYRHYALLAAPAMLHGALAFVGLAALMTGMFLWDALSHGRITDRIKEAVSLPNVCAALGGMLIPLIYLWGNVSARKPPQIGFGFVVWKDKPALYFCFIASFLCYSAVIYKEYRRSALFRLVNLELCLIPLFNLGYYNDFCMRASLPGTFLLMIFVIRALLAYAGKVEKAASMATLCLLLMWGSYYSVFETRWLLKEPTYFSLDGSVRENEAQTLADWANRDDTVEDSKAYAYFTYGYETSGFGRFFARQL